MSRRLSARDKERRRAWEEQDSAANEVDYKRRPPHWKWTTRQLGSYLDGVKGYLALSAAPVAVMTALCARADDHTGRLKIANDALADAAGIHRATLYRHLRALQASGLIEYQPGSIFASKGHPSRYRVLKVPLAAALVRAAEWMRARALDRRAKTTATADELVEVHRTPLQRVQDALFMRSHGATHHAPSGREVSDRPAPVLTPDHLRHAFQGDSDTDLSCLSCALPRDHPRHALSLTNGPP